MIRQSHLVLTVFYWWFRRTVGLDFHTYQLLNSSICVWSYLVSQAVAKSLSLYLRMLERGTKNYRPIRLLSSVSKISGMVSGLSVQLHIFWQLHLIQLLGLLVARYPKLSKGFDARAFTIMKFKASRNSRLDIWPSVFSQ